jgi:hypothetical protein
LNPYNITRPQFPLSTSTNSETNPSESAGLSGPAKTGIGVGVGLGAALVGLIVFLILFYRKKRKISNFGDRGRVPEMSSGKDGGERGGLSSNALVELSQMESRERAIELPAEPLNYWE